MSTRIAAGDLVFSSKFRKVLRAGGPWFESGQRTFVKLDKFNIKFRFSDFFGPFLHLEMSYANKLTSKTKFYVEFSQVSQMSSDRIRTTDPQLSRFF